MNNKNVKIENNDFEASITKNSPLFAMSLSIAKAYKMLQFSESQADAHNEVISVLLRHAPRHSSKFLFWIISLELQEKNLRQSKLCIPVCFCEKRNGRLSNDTAA